MSGAIPDLVPMLAWDSNLVREVTYYDINQDAMRQRFDYLGPNGITHHISNYDLRFDVRSKMIDALHKHYEANYARKED